MREILFRAKRQDNGEWIDGYLSYGNIIKTVRKCFDWRGDYVCDSLEEHKVDKETVGQFTGLTDKNGKKLFEDDICRVIYIDRRCNSNGEHYEAENIIIEEVVFEKGTFCFKTTIEDIAMYRPIGFDIYGKQKIKYFEIIGNVIDNPELLESE